MNLSRRQFAKFLNVSSFLYRYIEAGYIKPSRKAINNISKALNIDYESYFNDIRSYPKQIEEEEKGVAIRFRKLISKLWVKISLGVLLLGSIGVLSYGCYDYGYVINNSRSFYSSEYLEVVDGIREKAVAPFL